MGVPGRSGAPPARRLAVIGAGPIGLEAALYGRRLGYDVEVYEARAVGANILAWGHLQMFSPWALNVSALGAETLEAQGWARPDPRHCPTGRELVRRYLAPLAASPPLRGRVQVGVRVVSVARAGALKGDAIGDPSRARRPFQLLLEGREGERLVEADRVIDATGVYGQHNWLGDGGIRALGEGRAAERIAYWLEDVEGAHRHLYAGRHVLVVGAGHSAATVVCSIARLAVQVPGTRATWVVRSTRRPPVRRFDPDPLPLRDAVAREANRLAEGAHPAVRFLPGRVVGELRRRDRGLEVTLAPSGERLVVDRVAAMVGYRPDLGIGRELQLHTCWATEGPMKLATALVGGSGDCLAQSNPGPGALAMPEPGYLWLGHKAYGRNPSFLLRLGHEQVRDAFRLWEGDAELDLYAAARRRARRAAAVSGG